MQFLDNKRGIPFFDSSYTAVALNKADKLFKSSKRGLDKNVARALVLITDGEPTDTSDADALVRYPTFDYFPDPFVGTDNTCPSLEIKMLKRKLIMGTGVMAENVKMLPPLDLGKSDTV